MPNIKFWQSRLAEIYPNVDVTPDYLMAHLYTSTSELARLLLRSDYGKATDEYVIKSLTWMIAIATHFSVDLEDALLLRFPDVCKYCLRAPCECDRTGQIPLNSQGKRLSALDAEYEIESKYKAVRGGRALTFDVLYERINNIYPGNRTLLHRGGAAFVASKMLEEGGEIHRSYSNYLRGDGQTKRISEELGDLSGWVVSCWDLNTNLRSLDEAFANYFAAGCPVCHNKVCSCPPYSITKDHEEAIREAVNQLRALKNAGHNSQSIDDALSQAEAAAAEPTTEKKQNLAKRLKQLTTAAKAANEGADAGIGIWSKLNDVYDALSNVL